MNRRDFIISSAIVGSAALYGAEDSKELQVLESIINIMFPENRYLPSAKESGMMRYLLELLNDKNFDKIDKNALLEGAKKIEQENNFMSKNIKEQQEILSIFLQTRYGERWCSLLLYYCIEGLLGDPIYGGNKYGVGWSALKHKHGIPRPKKRWGEI